MGCRFRAEAAGERRALRTAEIAPLFETVRRHARAVTHHLVFATPEFRVCDAWQVWNGRCARAAARPPPGVEPRPAKPIFAAKANSCEISNWCER